MALVRLDAGGVYVVPGSPVIPATITGAPPQWADDSDSTYGTTCLTHRSFVSGDALGADIDTLPSATGVTTVTLHMRAKVWNAGAASGSGVQVALVNSAGSYVAYFGDDYHVQLPGTDAIYDVSTSVVVPNGSAPDPVALAAATLAGGASVHVVRFGSPYTGASKDHFVSVYELWITVEATPTRLRLAHNRGMQRGSDGQGVTGGKRGLQRKSRQSSLRGGSFL